MKILHEFVPTRKFLKLAEETKDLVRKHNPDLILININMPGINEIILNNDSQDILYLVEEADLECINGKDFICKPVKKAEVLNRIKVLIELRKLKEELNRRNRDLKEKERN